jgi:Transposase zinc-binding domain
MSEHRLEVADVFRTYGDDFLALWERVLSRPQRKAFDDIRACRTAALGGHVDQCDQCGHCAISYNSCRNRSCPKCQAAARAQWLAEREAELLPVEYFHVVFTLPQQIARLALQNARRIYSILFRAVAETLLTIAADPKRLGAAIGFLAVLHSWGQNLHGLADTGMFSSLDHRHFRTSSLQASLRAETPSAYPLRSARRRDQPRQLALDPLSKISKIVLPSCQGS